MFFKHNTIHFVYIFILSLDNSKNKRLYENKKIPDVYPNMCRMHTVYSMRIFN